MRVGVDGACWANRRGYGRFAREIVHEMVTMSPDDEFICFVDPEARAHAPLEASNLRLITVAPTEAPTTAAASDGARSLSDMLRFTRAVWREPLDVFFSPSVYTYFPLPPGLPAVVTVHDAIAERFPELTLPSRRARLFWNAKVGLAMRHARLVLTVSEYAKRDVASVHRFPEARLRVAVEAPAEAYRPISDPDAVRQRAAAVGLPPDARWLMYVGGFNPHKNVDMIVRAHAQYVADHPSEDAPHLVLVGHVEGDVFHGSLADTRAAIEEAGTQKLVHWPGFVPDEDLAHLHSGALALLLVSEAEGFGLPAVEAAACGCPVIATTESPLPEILSGGGIFLDPGNQAALDAAVTRIIDDTEYRAGLSAGALAGASALSWKRAAAAAMDALRTAAE
jgi:glycosyltransferase involved in cell wall biosynthesis